MTNPAFVSCPDLTDDDLRQVLRELKAARDEPSRIGRALAVFRYHADWHQVLWHIARHRLVRVEDHGPLLDVLAETATIDPSSSPDLPQLGADLLARLPDGRDHGLPGGWNQHVDDLVFALYRHDPAPFLALRASLPPRLRCALDFVRGRVGDRLGDAERADVLAMLLAHAGSVGLTTFEHLRLVDDAGEQELMLRSAAEVRTVALRFGSGEAWDDGLLAGVRNDRWTRFDDVLPALARLPLDELIQRLLPRCLSAGLLHALLSDRSDSDEALRAAAEALTSDPPGAWLRHGLTEVLKARAAAPIEKCTVRLVRVGPNRMRLIKLLATRTPVGVQGARAAVEAAPAELVDAMPVAEARSLAAEVEALGGEIALDNFRTHPGHVVSDPLPW
ncbi:ribosomal protein L7/L12 [Nannocystis punicea]|uniref:Ribosomal protein L7/L12 n=1 Tax=Nannocystis punicea TaxID=2995304 RepID=A0ABY7H0F6_9BACT|nr:ribosomal protein L7/L12 [Nannocystis poenicansa]WAS92658.1 ribosomal protein L7/L12 [Nannocystis poenicansa]